MGILKVKNEKVYYDNLSKLVKKICSLIQAPREFFNEDQYADKLAGDLRDIFDEFESKYSIDYDKLCEYNRNAIVIHFESMPSGLALDCIYNSLETRIYGPFHDASIVCIYIHDFIIENYEIDFDSKDMKEFLEGHPTEKMSMAKAIRSYMREHNAIDADDMADYLLGHSQ